MLGCHLKAHFSVWRKNWKEMHINRNGASLCVLDLVVFIASFCLLVFPMINIHYFYVKKRQ